LAIGVLSSQCWAELSDILIAVRGSDYAFVALRVQMPRCYADLRDAAERMLCQIVFSKLACSATQ